MTGARKTNYGTRLDYILVTDALASLAEWCEIRPEFVGSDHCPVEATFPALELGMNIKSSLIFPLKLIIIQYSSGDRKAAAIMCQIYARVCWKTG